MSLRKSSLVRRHRRRLLVVFTLFQRNSRFEDGAGRRGAEKFTDDAADFGRIRCPLCRWRPRASSRWYCADDFSAPFFHSGCGTAWNTFDTRGRCPGCGHQWRFTDCLRCGGRSPHDDWYEKKGETG